MAKTTNIPAAKKKVAPKNKNAAADKTTTKLKAAMNGKASPAKAAVGDKPVFDNRQFAVTTARHRRAHRCLGGEDLAGPPALGEMGNGVLRS